MRFHFDLAFLARRPDWQQVLFNLRGAASFRLAAAARLAWNHPATAPTI